MALAVFISPTSVQAVPFHFSTIAPGPPRPAIPKASVEVPPPSINRLAVFKSPTSVQAVPLYNSFIAVNAVGLDPPNEIAAVLLPHPA